MSEPVPYPKLRGSDSVTETCGKCDGSGYLQGFERIDGGRCWACMGQGSRTVLVSSVRARIRRRAKRAAARAEQETARLASVGADTDRVIAALTEAFPRFADAIDDTGRVLTADAAEVISQVRHHGLEVHEAVANYRWMLGETASDLRPNRFRGTCDTCDTVVTPGAGWVGQVRNRGWITYCGQHIPDN